jgi:hypothetical protein
MFGDENDEDYQAFYMRVKQRQKLGEHTWIDHVDWMDLFQDLVFGWACGSLSTVLIDQNASFISLLYFLAYYLQVYKMWHHKLEYDARFSPGDEGDVAHKLLDLVMLVWTLGATLHIRPPSYDVGDAKSKFATMWFSTMLGLYNLGAALRWLEIRYYGDQGNDPGAKVFAAAEANIHLLTFSVFAGTEMMRILR